MAEEINETNPNENIPDPVFTVDDTTKQFFEDYVGPGKKYPNVGELAKAYANADNHITSLTKDVGIFKTETESLRELLMENLVDNKPKPNEDPKPNDAAPQQPPVDAAPPKEDGNDDNVDLKALVKEALDEASTEEKRRSNARTTEEATIKKFGSSEDAVKAIAAKAEELGLSPQWIANLAFESPKAYFATMGFTPDETPRSNSTPAPHSDVNPNALKETNKGIQPGTYRYFQELRRTDPAKYRSNEVQQAIMKQAQENPNFYN
jgi:hypothetical protein